MIFQTITFCLFGKFGYITLVKNLRNYRKMAARCVCKLVSKTYAYTVQSTCPLPLSTISTEKCYHRQQRSYSQPPQKNLSGPPQEHFFQLRSLSKSLENLREIRHREEDYEEQPQKQAEDMTYSNRHNSFPHTADLSIRDPAKEFKDKYVVEETNDEGNPIYELTEGCKSEENFIDVLNTMRRAEEIRQRSLFIHLQPGSLKPYGSTETLHSPHLTKRKKLKVVYPVTTTTSQTEVIKKSKRRQTDREYSTDVMNYEEPKKISSTDSKPRFDQKNYSTACTKKKTTSTLKPSVKITKRRSSSVILKKKYKNENILENKKPKVVDVPVLAKKLSYSRLGHVRSTKNLILHRTTSRKHHNVADSNPTEICTDYVTVKLGDLKEECRKAKKCKPKKICFGRLPKLPPNDCPCLDDIPLKPGKPLLRLKKRFDIPDRDNTCEDKTGCTTPRADDNYKIKPKTLPKIEAKDCPCVEHVMVDFEIKRLPKKHIPEPPKVCCIGPQCEVCPPRADGDITVTRKTLPKLQINNCPCVEETPLKDVPLKKLKAAEIKEPEKICPDLNRCDETLRADYNMKVEKKSLPYIKGNCPCPQPEPMKEAPPLPRLPKFKFEEKPRGPCDGGHCDESQRADGKMKVPKKKLPKFVPANCPCIEPPVPSGPVQLKRLPPKHIPEPPKICKPPTECGPRADDGMKVEPKKLPLLEPKECPCVPHEMKDSPPLKRLPPVDIPEPPKICIDKTLCTMPRADGVITVSKKKLPVLPANACPCIEPPPPLEVKPLKKLKPKPVTHTKVVCPEKQTCPPRADENYKVKMKKLPKLQINNCPCIEPEPPLDVPLTRLPKVEVTEPRRVCPKLDDCDDVPRSDEDDWLYYKQIEVDCEEVPAKASKTGRRKFSTSAIGRRHYSTNSKQEIDEIFNLKYQIPNIVTHRIAERPHNLIIDIKPSAPLILTQKPINAYQRELLERCVPRQALKRSNSEPVDCVNFIIYKSNGFGSGRIGMNRYISTCSTLCEYSERSSERAKNQAVCSCECPPNDQHLQPKNPLIPEREIFITPYPDEDMIDASIKKSRKYCRTRKDDVSGGVVELDEECVSTEKRICTAPQDSEEPEREDECEKKKEETKKDLNLWEKIINYFKARPNCPSPEEYKKIRLKQEAERAAFKAGLCLYDPKEMLQKTEKELPKVITAGSLSDECEK